MTRDTSIALLIDADNSPSGKIVQNVPESNCFGSGLIGNTNRYLQSKANKALNCDSVDFAERPA